MTKANMAHLSKTLSTLGDVPRHLANVYTQIIIDTLFFKLVELGKIHIHGYGTFCLRDIKAKVGRNPKTGEPVHCPACRKVVFKPSPQYREVIKSDWERACDLVEKINGGD